MRATNIPSLHTRTNIFCSVHTTQASLTLVFWFYKEPSRKKYKFYIMNPLSLCRTVNEVLPPLLDSSSEPPPVFDGTTRLVHIDFTFLHLFNYNSDLFRPSFSTDIRYCFKLIALFCFKFFYVNLTMIGAAFSYIEGCIYHIYARTRSVCGSFGIVRLVSKFFIIWVLLAQYVCAQVGENGTSTSDFSAPYVWLKIYCLISIFVYLKKMNGNANLN